MALYLGLAYLFTQFSVLPQLVGYVLHVNLYVAYMFGVPAIVAALLSGGFKRTFRARTSVYWVGLGCWMLIATPFSSWPGGSASQTIDYWKTAIFALVIAGGMIMEWGDVRKFMNMVAASAIVTLFCGSLAQAGAGDRMGAAFGTIGNPNDFAAHLLLLLPFSLWALLTGKIIWRVIALACLAIGLYMVLATGSRGALIAIGVDTLLLTLLGGRAQRIGLLLLGPIAAVALMALVPGSALQRLSMIWNDSATAQTSEAIASSAARQYVLTTSIRYTQEHPLFGVGPGQFPNYEGGHERIVGRHGYWHETHNSFTQISAECGIPGLLFFVAGVVSTLLMLFKTYRQARRRPNCKDMRLLLLCMLIGVTGFDVAITFLNFGYFFYLPALGGMAVGVWASAQREFEIRDAALAAGVTQ